jgi:hypothetical protein
VIPELERLIELYARLRETRPEEREPLMQALLRACEPYARNTGGDVEKVLEFVKSAYLRKRAADNRRAGRPPGFGA